MKKINLKKTLLAGCLLSFSVLVNANSFSVQEISTMARMGVKVAFSGELSPHVVTTRITPAQMITAEMLDLSNLGLHQLPSWLTRFSKLRDLNLSDNKLVQAELEEVKSMKVLEVLNLNKNPLGKGQLTEFFKVLPNLRSLFLSVTKSCNLSTSVAECFGDFKVLRSLKKLDISNNSIRRVDLANFSSTLEELKLANNYLGSNNSKSYIKFADMPSLQKLSLQKNGSYLSLPSKFGDAFTMQQLRVLDIDSNIKIPEGLKHKLESWKK